MNEIHELSRKQGFNSLEVVRGKGRTETYHRFVNYKHHYPNDLCVLLVDSEGPVGTGQLVWDVVASRTADHWSKPAWAGERHLYLMVQFVETWILADLDALKTYFKQGFTPDNLPATNLENRSKHEIEQALERATQNSRRGSYRHGQAHEIMEFVRPSKVQTLFHGNRIFTVLATLIKEEGGRV